MDALVKRLVAIEAEAAGTADAIAVQRRLAQWTENQAVLQRQHAANTQVELVSLLVHDLCHQSFSVCEALEEYTERCRRALAGAEPGLRAALEEDAHAAMQSALKLQQTLQHLRSVRTGQEPGLMERSEFDLNDVLDEVEATLGGALMRHRVTIKRSIPGGVRLAGVRWILTQVFFNLVINSIEAARAGSAGGAMTIDVLARKELAGGPPRLVVCIWDDGPGIDPGAFKNPEAVFQAGTTTKPNGTGLGLSMSRGLLEKYFQGAMELEEPATARFRITLPIPKRKTNYARRMYFDAGTEDAEHGLANGVDLLAYTNAERPVARRYATSFFVENGEYQQCAKTKEVVVERWFQKGWIAPGEQGQLPWQEIESDLIKDLFDRDEKIRNEAQAAGFRSKGEIEKASRLMLRLALPRLTYLQDLGSDRYFVKKPIEVLCYRGEKGCIRASAHGLGVLVDGRGATIDEALADLQKVILDQKRLLEGDVPENLLRYAKLLEERLDLFVQKRA